MKEIIRKFDETICEKISKVHLMEYQAQVQDIYSRKYDLLKAREELLDHQTNMSN